MARQRPRVQRRKNKHSPVLQSVAKKNAGIQWARATSKKQIQSCTAVGVLLVVVLGTFRSKRKQTQIFTGRPASARVQRRKNKYSPVLQSVEKKTLASNRFERLMILPPHRPALFHFSTMLLGTHVLLPAPERDLKARL
jgi:hypothetical protein